MEGAALRERATEARAPAFDDGAWRRRMLQTDIAAELFLPVENAEWRKQRLRLRRDERREARTRITGVRLLAADPTGEDKEPERETQTDFRRLVDSLIKLREVPDCGDLVLSGDTFRTSPRVARRTVPRYRFGLARGADKMADDRCAARASHARIKSAIRRAGFVILSPKERFDPRAGLVGLREWADQLRLRRRRPIWPWLLPLFLLLLIPRCDPSETFFGVPIETQSLVVIVDRSSSMKAHFAALRTEAKQVLARMRENGTSYADVIAYDSKAQSCLGKIAELDDQTAAKLDQFLDGLSSGGGTNLESGLQMAAAEVAKHERPTTLVILTDASDGSIAKMVQEGPKLLERFQGVKVVGHGLTPRLFGGNDDPTPQDAREHAFSELVENLGGHFGPATRGRAQRDSNQPGAGDKSR